MINGEPVRVRRRWWVVTAMAVAAVLVAGAGPAVLLAGDAAVPAVAATVAASPTPSPSRRPPTKTDIAVEQINAALQRQSAALLRGDRDAFVGAAVPSQQRLLADLRRRFDSLRALGVAGYKQTVVGRPASDNATDWRTEISVEHCFGRRGCGLEQVKVRSGWRLGPDGARLLYLNKLSGPLPYEVSALTARLGPRTIVATTKRYAPRLRAVSAMAERAAKVADRFALGGRPERYVVFMAGPKEYEQWYGGASEWTAGFAIAVVGSRTDVVVRMEDSDTAYLEALLRHELTHAATVGGWRHSSGGSNWWLIEGIANHAENSPTSGYHPWVRRLVREDGWKGDLTALSSAGDDDWWIAANYTAAHLAVRRIAERFGKDKLLQFTGAVLHQGYTPSGAASEYLGKSWSNVRADCWRYIQRQAGL